MIDSVKATAIGTAAQAFLKRLLAEAPLCGLGLDERVETTTGGAVVLVFDPSEPDLPSHIRDLSDAGRKQVLGVLVGADQGSAVGWRFVQAGLSDILRATENAAEICRQLKLRLDRVKRLDAVLHSDLVRNNLIGSSPTWLKALRQVAEAAMFGTLPILLTGHSGTGKELCARLIQSLPPKQKQRDLIVVDCTTLNPDLSGSELFGHEKGAFTGAVGARQGAFALADGGTLFLDEIGELDRLLQVQLLRAIQEKRYKRVGSNDWKRSDFRLISATNRDLRGEVAEGRFRADLFHRIAGCTICLPRLADRREDIVSLVRYFLRDCIDADTDVEIDPAVVSVLISRDYPGNVRELQQIVQRIALRYPGEGPITPGMVPSDLRPTPETALQNTAPAFDDAVAEALKSQMSLKDIGREATDAAVRLALAQCDGNVAAAARLLSVTPRTLQLRQAQQAKESSDPSV